MTEKAGILRGGGLRFPIGPAGLVDLPGGAVAAATARRDGRFDVLVLVPPGARVGATAGRGHATAAVAVPGEGFAIEAGDDKWQFAFEAAPGEKRAQTCAVCRQRLLGPEVALVCPGCAGVACSFCAGASQCLLCGAALEAES